VVHFTRKKEAGTTAGLDSAIAASSLLLSQQGSQHECTAPGPLGMAAVTAGVYCAGRYITDIGVRKDVVKVEVENLSAHLGCRRAAAETKKQPDGEQANKGLLPLKRKRDFSWTKY
jgi:hypothetical protein